MRPPGDDAVKARVTQADRDPGLFLDGDNWRLWIKTWSQLIQEWESRFKFIQDRLRIEVSDAEIEERIAALEISLVKGESGKVVPFPKDATGAAPEQHPLEGKAS